MTTQVDTADMTANVTTDMTTPHLILVVEDSADLRELLDLTLTAAGYRVAAAPDARAGLELARELAPDLVLVDMMMPELDGLEFLARLPAALPSPPHVVAMSGFDAFEREALARGAEAFLRKPFTNDDVLAVVEAVLGGTKLDASTLTTHAERAAERRRHTARLREGLLARVDLDAPEVRDRLRSVVEWCAGYFDVNAALVNIEREDQIHFQAASGGEPDFPEGGSIDASRTFCTLVVDAASPMIVGDGDVQSVFAWHPMVLAGYNFYAGVPLRSATGVVIGTLCILDHEPRAFHSEDLGILEVLADGIGRRLSRLAGLTTHGPMCFVVPDVFTRDVFHTLVSAEVRRIGRTGGSMEIAHVDVGTDDTSTYRRCARLVYDDVGRKRLGIAAYSDGVIGVVVGADSRTAARDRVDRAIQLLSQATSLQGAGVVSVQPDSALSLETRGFEAVADEARARSVSRGRGLVERVVLGPAFERSVPA